MNGTHTHADDKLVFGCPGCIANARALEETARWETAPRRRCTWHCRYLVHNERGDVEEHTLEFSIVVRVPADATTDEIDDHYIDDTGEEFVFGLPDSIPMAATEEAMCTMSVEKITVGAIVPDVEQPAPVAPSLFEVAT